MRKYPIACAVAIISLAMGIGATTGMLTIRNAVFRNPPPLSPHPEELLEAFMPTPQHGYRAAVPAGAFSLWADEARVLSGIAAATPNIARDVRTPESVEMLSVRSVTPQLFSVLGVAPAVGRSLSTESTAVISHKLWQRTFRGQLNAVGSVLWIDGKAHTVVGIMPERFWAFDLQTDVWTPLDVKLLPSDALLEVIVRRRPDVTIRAVTDAFENDVVRYLNTLPNDERRARVQVVQMQGTPISHAIAPGVVWLIAACVLLTLLIACTNVAVLVIAQWTGREREFAICAALGSGRWRIVRGLVTESLLLAFFGGLLGVSATIVFLAVALRRAPSSVEFNFAIDAGVLIRTALITVSAGILAGLAPALYETQRFQSNPLRAIPSDRVRQRWRNALVVTEITVTIALLVVTSTIVDGYRRAVSEDLGYDIRPLLAVAVEAPQGVRIAEINERLRALPGLTSVAATTTPAMSQASQRQSVALNGGGSNSMMAHKAIVSSEFWKTLGIPIRIGRGFSADEDRSECGTCCHCQRSAGGTHVARTKSGRIAAVDGRAAFRRCRRGCRLQKRAVIATGAGLLPPDLGRSIATHTHELLRSFVR
jgi:predicted permease